VGARDGGGDRRRRLRRMAKTGQWEQVAVERPGDRLGEFCLYAPYDALPEAIEGRFGGISDTVEFGFEDGTDRDFARDVIERVHRIDSRFEAPANHYA